MLSKHSKIATAIIAAALLSMPLISACSSSETSSGTSSNVVTELKLPEVPGEYQVESNSWTTIPDGMGGQMQVHIVHCAEGKDYVIPYEDTAMTTVSTDTGTLIVNDDTKVTNPDEENVESRGEEVKKYQLLLPSKDWEGRVQRGSSSQK